MGILDRLFRRKNDVPTRMEPVATGTAAGDSDGSRRFTESDNAGTRQSSDDQAIAYWATRNMRQKFDPFILYIFPNEASARSALLALDCIHEARDTGKLICTMPLVFGHYSTEGDEYEAIIAGEALPYDLWQKAKESFEKHGGRRKTDQAPEEQPVSAPDKARMRAGEVKFNRKYTKGVSVYEVYACDDVELAIEFLLTKSVEKQQYYIVVDTPMGAWGMDIKGLFKEHLLPWQTDMGSAEVEGQTLGIPDSFSLQMAARGINDNFVISVICGDCGHQWPEGLRYQDWTVVQCPRCHKRNKVGSHNYSVSFV